MASRTWDFTAPSLGGGVSAFGNISAADYNAFFGVGGSPADYAFLLFDLDSVGVDVSAPLFVTRIWATGPSPNTPDPEAFAVLSSSAQPIPEPGSIVLVLLGGLLVGLRLRRR